MEVMMKPNKNSFLSTQYNIFKIFKSVFYGKNDILNPCRFKILHTQQ